MREKPVFKKAFCEICGAEFQKITGNHKYCSDKCYKEACKHYKSAKYKPRKPRQIICIKCGNAFSGRSNQKICMDCLQNRPDCKRYLLMRSEAMMIGG